MKGIGHSRASGRGGFSLIEITLALMVIAIGLLGIMALVPGAWSIQAETRLMIDARLISERILGSMLMGETSFDRAGVKLEFDADGRAAAGAAAVLQVSIRKLPTLLQMPPNTIRVAIQVNAARTGEEIYTLQAIVPDRS